MFCTCDRKPGQRRASEGQASYLGVRTSDQGRLCWAGQHNRLMMGAYQDRHFPQRWDCLVGPRCQRPSCQFRCLQPSLRHPTAVCHQRYWSRRSLSCRRMRLYGEESNCLNTKCLIRRTTSRARCLVPSIISLAVCDTRFLFVLLDGALYLCCERKQLRAHTPLHAKWTPREGCAAASRTHLTAYWQHSKSGVVEAFAVKR